MQISPGKDSNIPVKFEKEYDAYFFHGFPIFHFVFQKMQQNCNSLNLVMTLTSSSYLSLTTGTWLSVCYSVKHTGPNQSTFRLLNLQCQFLTTAVYHIEDWLQLVVVSEVASPVMHLRIPPTYFGCRKCCCIPVPDIDFMLFSQQCVYVHPYIPLFCSFLKTPRSLYPPEII